jgi:hypothetical protein
MPDSACIDLDFRPATYWDPGDVVVANILGDVRKANVMDAVREGWTERLPPWYFAERLSWEQIELLCLTRHLASRGGEGLPAYLREEVEIARVTFDPAVRTVVAIRARPSDGGIRYRAVGEDEAEVYASLDESQQPLTLREVVRAVFSLRRKQAGGRSLIVERREEAAARHGLLVAVEHIKVSSVHYPAITAYCAELALRWAEFRLSKAHARGVSPAEALLGSAASAETEGRGTFPLHAAAADGDLAAVERLLRDGRDVNERAPEAVYGAPCRRIRSFSSNGGLAARLMERAGAIPSGLCTGATPLHLAAAFGRSRVARVLLAAGASVSARDARGLSPGEVARQEGHLDVAALLDAACRASEHDCRAG